MEIAASQPATSLASRRELFCWALYDWANSAYSTLSITILNGYLLHFVFPKDDWQTTGDVVWAWGLAASMLVAGVLSPIVGALADRRASKRRWLAATALGGAAGAILLALAPIDAKWLIVALFMLVSFCFELSLGVYNAFLPELTDEAGINRASAWGFALGYIGGGLALLLVLLFLPSPPQANHLRVGVAAMGLWWGVFSLPSILVLRDRATPRDRDKSLAQIARLSFLEVGHTLKNVRTLPMLTLFLLGFLFYNDGVQTVLSQASTFATRVLEFTPTELAKVILMIQFVAFPGALLVGWISDRMGQRFALFLCLAVWTALLVAAWFIETKAQFWVLGVVVALVMGGIQSVSRAIMGVLTPPARTAEFFGFFNLSGKTTSFMGTFTFGLIVHQTNNARLAIISLLAFILLGWLIVARVDLTAGRKQALNSK